MASQKQLAIARRLASTIHRQMGEDVERLRSDAGVPRSQLAEVAGIDVTYLRRIEYGLERPSIDTYAKLATALGADLSTRLFPNTGPAIRDRHQARILEALLGLLHGQWRSYPEVAVRRPARGWIDVLLHAEREGDVVAIEIQSDLRRLEQLLRWFPEKVASLPSWEGWPHIGSTKAPSRMLIVRSTDSTRRVAKEFQRQLLAAYPAHPSDAIAALRGQTPWPGPALIWADFDADRVRFVGRR